MRRLRKANLITKRQPEFASPLLVSPVRSETLTPTRRPLPPQPLHPLE